MATLCPVWVEKMVKVKEYARDKSGNLTATIVIVPIKKKLVCGCKVAGVVRVHYRELSPHRRGEGKYDDLFGLCANHLAKLSEDSSAWNDGGDHWRPGVASGLRGVVERVDAHIIDPSSASVLAQDDKTQRLMAAIKAEFKRKMGQSNARHLSVDNWRQLLNEIVDEWVTEEIMDS